MSLFIKKNLILHSSQPSDFKIECDSLTGEDLETLAYLIAKKVNFCDVVGVPKGGLKIAEKLKQYAKGMFSEFPFLIVDDVLTTGNSMIEIKKNYACSKGIIGVVLFARNPCPSWITPVFQLMI